MRNAILTDPTLPAVLGFTPSTPDEVIHALDSLTSELRCLLTAGAISDHEARVRLAEATMKYDVPAMGVNHRQYHPGARHVAAGNKRPQGRGPGFEMRPIEDWEVEDIHGRVTEKVIADIMAPVEQGGYDFFWVTRQRDGVKAYAKFSSYVFHKASLAALQYTRDERRQFSARQDSTDPVDLLDLSPWTPDAHDEWLDNTDTLRIDNILVSLNSASFMQMRGARKVHVAAVAARVALGLPAVTRLTSPEARSQVRELISADKTLSRKCARNVLLGTVAYPVIEAVWDGWDHDALTTVISLGDPLCNGLVASAVEDLPRPPVRHMAAFVRAITKAGDQTDVEWKALCADLAASIVAIECETVSPYSVTKRLQAHNEQLLAEAEADRKAWNGRLERAAAWDGAPLGSDPTTVADYLRTILLNYVPIPTEDDLLNEATLNA